MVYTDDLKIKKHTKPTYIRKYITYIMYMRSASRSTLCLFNMSVNNFILEEKGGNNIFWNNKIKDLQ